MFQVTPILKIIGKEKGGLIKGWFWRTCGPGSQFSLSGPISGDIAILSLRYPISRDTFKGG